MTISVTPLEGYTWISFADVRSDVTKDKLGASLALNILNLSKTNNLPILVDMSQIRTIDNDSVDQLIKVLSQNQIKVGFYALNHFVKNSFVVRGVEQKFIFAHNDAAFKALVVLD